MSEFPSLPLLVANAAEGCKKTILALDALGTGISTSRSTFSSLLYQCQQTQAVLARLETFLEEEPWDSADHALENDCCSSFEVAVQAICATTLELGAELSRLQRYAVGCDPFVRSKFNPVLQDSLFDARSDLRRNNASLNLILDCIQSGILAGVKAQLQQPVSEKPAETTRMRPHMDISLVKQSTRPHIQQQMMKVRPKPSRSFKLGSQLTKKLHEAIATNNYHAVCKYLSEKADPNAPHKDSKMTPIHRALGQAEEALGCEDEIASRDSSLIITALVLAGADLRAVDEERRTPLARAAKGEMGDELVALMLDYGANVNATDKEQNTPLHYAAMQHASAEMGNMKTIRILLALGADQNIRNQRGRTALYKAVMWENITQAAELLDYGADLDISDNNGWTALYGAVLQGNVGLTQLLCGRGAFVDKKDKTGQTALHYAVSQGRQDIVEVLVNAGADVNIISKGETALCRATAKANAGLVSYLLSQGADASVPSLGYNGALPIHIAAVGKDLEVLKVLVEKNRDLINTPDTEGKTPLVWAKEAEKTEAMHFLLNMGATAQP
ncbi:hypothetical protein JX265_013647 [Neoarthrinium moseri]|uniref:Ankyrin repeat protein n=1 Tax=Neoarthrinium moseri TaxID=1658444 RepID=A0A9P9W885_9PEZI|nr:hypothetical protein JX265_013647 [Neoarthrinium moseri]